MYASSSYVILIVPYSYQLHHAAVLLSSLVNDSYVLDSVAHAWSPGMDACIPWIFYS